MTHSPMNHIRFVAMWLLPIVLVAGGFLLAVPWLRTLDDNSALVASAGAAVFVMGWSVYMSVRGDRLQDEVERAGSRFAWQWGAVAGSVFTVLLTLSPPFLRFIVETASTIATDSPGQDLAIERAFFLGFMTLMIAQAVGAIIFNVGWRVSKR